MRSCVRMRIYQSYQSVTLAFFSTIAMRALSGPVGVGLAASSARLTRISKPSARSSAGFTRSIIFVAWIIMSFATPRFWSWNANCLIRKAILASPRPALRKMSSRCTPLSHLATTRLKMVIRVFGEVALYPASLATTCFSWLGG